MTVSRDHYYRLASEVPQERIEAATSLLSELQDAQSNEEWEYALNRLIKGLTSTRQSAKIGFSMALIEVLAVLIKDPQNELTVSGYLQKLLELTEVKSAMKGKEERAVLFGRLFGCQVILNSGILFDSAHTSSDDLKAYATVLIDLAVTKSWLRESTVFNLYTFVSQTVQLQGKPVAAAAAAADFTAVWIYVLQKINDAGLSLTTEGLAIYVAIPRATREEYSLEQKAGGSQGSWKANDPLAKGNLPLLVKVLKDVDVVDDGSSAETSGTAATTTKNKPTQKSNWSPRVHFVWDLILQEFAEEAPESAEDPSDGKKRKKHAGSSEKAAKKAKKNNREAQSSSQTSGESRISLKEFWKVVVDESLFSEKASHERKYWGFEIFSKFLAGLEDPASVHELFTPNLMRCLINQSSQQNRFLNKISVQVLKTIVEVASKEPKKAPVVLASLLDDTRGGCWNFDLVTKSRTVDEVLGGSQDAEAMEQFKELLVEKFHAVAAPAPRESNSKKDHDGESDDAFDDASGEAPGDSLPLKLPHDNVQKWCLDKLLHLTRSHKNLLKDGQHSAWLDGILKLLVKNSFFKSKGGDATISSNIKNLSQERLNSILSDVINLKNQKNEPWPLLCIEYIRKLEQSSDGEYELVSEFDQSLVANRDEILDILAQIKKGIKKADSKSKKKSKTGAAAAALAAADQLYCFQLLFSMVLIQFYMADEEAVSVLEELKLCYNDIAASKKGSEDDDGDAEAVDSSLVLTEIILSFVARKSTLLKKLSMIIWENFLCSKNDEGKVRLNEGCLQLLYDVLESKENKEGLEKVFEGQGEYEADDSGSDELDDEKEEEEEEEDEEEEEEEDSSDSDSEDVDDSTVDKVEKETSLKLAEALGIPSSSGGEVKFEDLSDGDDDSYESDSMDDEQMMEIDDQLSKIFKERRDALTTVVTGSKRKSEVIEAKEQMIFFKNRILDLLELLNKHQPASYLNLTMIKPVITLIGLTLDKNVGLKAHKLLKTKISKTRVLADQISENFDSDEEQEVFKQSLLELVQWLHKRARTSSNQSHSMACNQACIIVSKNLIGIDESYLDQVIEVYTQSLKEWATNKKSKIQASMFFDFINWLNSKRESK